MGLIGWIFYLLLGIFFFLILLFLEHRFQIQKLDKMIFSIILLMIAAGFCFSIGLRYTENIFLSFVFLMVTDVIYSSYFVERDFFDKKERNLFYYFVLIFIGFLINQAFINQVTQVFLTGEDFRILLWALSFVFLYYFCKNHKIFASTIEDKDHFISHESVLIRYAKLKYQFNDDCNFEDKNLTKLIYAIMIFEDNRRGRILRNYDYFMFRLTGNKRKLGIMQIESNQFITDSASIQMAYDKLESISKKNQGKAKKNIKIKDIIKEYDEKNEKYIQYIFDIIQKI